MVDRIATTCLLSLAATFINAVSVAPQTRALAITRVDVIDVVEGRIGRRLPRSNSDHLVRPGLARSERGKPGTAPLSPSKLPHHSEAETLVTLLSPFARYAGEFRVGGELRPRQERWIPVNRRSQLKTMREPDVETAAKCRGESDVRQMVRVRQSRRLPERLAGHENQSVR